jgi:hypothetical protein
MKMKLLQFSILSLLTLQGYSQFISGGTVGGTSNNYSSNAVSYSSGGSYYIGGNFSGTTDFDPGPGVSNETVSAMSNAYIIKFNSSDQFQWAKVFNCPTWSTIQRIENASNGSVLAFGVFRDSVDIDPGPGTTYVTVNSSQHVFIVSLDSSGTYNWHKVLKNVSTSFNTTSVADVELDADGNILCAGIFRGIVDFDPSVAQQLDTSLGYEDNFLLKLDPSGNYIWHKTWGYTGGYGSSSALALINETIYYSIGSNVNIDLDPGSGTDYNSTPGNNSAIIKLDETGNYIFAKIIPIEFVDIAPTPDEHLIVSGGFVDTIDIDPNAGITFLVSDSGSYDAVIAKYDTSTLNLVWGKSFGGASTDFLLGVECNLNGDIYVDGRFWSTVDFDPGSNTFELTPWGNNLVDPFISQFDGSGNFICAMKLTGNSTAEHILDLKVNSLGNVFVCGVYSDTIDLDPSPFDSLLFYNAITWDGFYIKLGSNFICSATSIPVFEKQIDFNVFPNPSNGLIHINNIPYNSVINVYDQTGRMIASEKQNNDLCLIDLSLYNNGLYFIEFVTDQKRGVKKVVIQR